jgi:hypothetical protein
MVCTRNGSKRSNSGLSVVGGTVLVTKEEGGFQRAMDDTGSLLTKLEQIRFKRRTLNSTVENHLSFKIVESETFKGNHGRVRTELTNLEQITKRRIIELVENHLP